MTQLPANSTIKGKMLRDGASGVRSRCMIVMAANAVDAEQVVIGDEVYVFDQAASGVDDGQIQVTGQTANTPALAGAALVSAINTNTSYPITAVEVDTGVILLITDNDSDLSITCSTDMTGTGNTMETEFHDGQDHTLVRAQTVAAVPTAAEVAAGSLVIPVDFTPTGVLVGVRTTSTGAAVSWDGAVTIDSDNNLVVLDNSGSTDWATTSTVSLLVF